MTTAITDFDRCTGALVASVSAHEDVLGLVLLGSGAERTRLDEWSDHDFYLVVRDGTQERFRQDLSWLPDHHRVVLAPRETEHGLKVVYDDGHVLELAVASPAEAATFGANHWLVVLDRGPVTAAMREAAARTAQPRAVDAERSVGLFLSLLLIGVGRARRGEALTAGEFVRGHALSALLEAWADRVPTQDGALVDRLDPRRRFETAYPQVGGRLADLLAQPPEPAAHDLLLLAEEVLAPGWAGWPVSAVAAVRRRLGWAPRP